MISHNRNLSMQKMADFLIRPKRKNYNKKIRGPRYFI